MSNKCYDALKWIALIVLPAIGALYFALSQLWELPYAKEIVGTVTAINTFIQRLFGISALPPIRKST